ncbi:MAG: hypothetical protein AB1458_02490 [Bacteroidota bacterium]
MRMTEKVIVVLAALSLGAKFLLLPEGDLLFLYAMCALMLLYFPFGIFLFQPRPGLGFRLLISVFGGMLFAASLLGILLKLLLAGDPQLPLQVSIMMLLAFLGFLLWRRSKRGDEVADRYYRNFIQRNIVILSVAGVAYLVPVNGLIRFQFRNDSSLAEMIIQCRDKNGQDSCWQRIQTYRENKILQQLDVTPKTP